MTEPFLASDIEEIANRIRGPAAALAGKTVLIAGGHGFLGRYFAAVLDHLSDHVLSTPCRVVSLDNLITSGLRGGDPVQPKHGIFQRHDVIRPFACPEKIDYVVFLAGIASPFYYRAYPLETLDVAVLGARNLLELATNKGSRFVFFSSSEIYGDPDPAHVPTPESYRGNVACRGPRACYDESKRIGETLCYIYHEKFGTSINIVRPFNIYGPGMREADYRVLPNFASRLKAGRPLNVYGTGRQTRTFCYITDAMVGFLLVLLRGVPGEAYNIGTPKPEVSMEDLVGHVERVLGRPVARNLIEYPDSYPGDEPNRRCPDIRKARLQLEYDPEVDLDAGLARFLFWTDKVYTGEQ